MDIKSISKNMGLIKYTILFMSIVLIGMGLYRDEMNIVFTKAINICLECIGIG